MGKEECTKQYIIKYLKDYYKKHNKTPIARDTIHPFSCKTVSNKFGSWGDALIYANIPLNVNKPIEVICKKCEKQFIKLANQIKKSKNNFCSRSCSAKYNNSIRIRSEETNNKTRLTLQKPHKCLICEVIIPGGRRKTCSQLCLSKHNKISSIKGGKKGGLASVLSQQRRSKNEIYMAELCISHFGEIDIQCNEQIFKDKNGNFWDCDIFIKSLKTAILWDGWYWHYSPNISNRQKARDVLKRKIILDNGYKYYTIIDKGKFNKSFVEYEFYLFLHKVQFKSSLDQVEKKVNLNRDFL